MEYGKYIIVTYKGCHLAIIFNPMVEHSYFSTLSNNRIISAGFFRVEITENKDISIITFGRSASLHLTSKKGDAVLIAEVLKK